MSGDYEAVTRHGEEGRSIIERLGDAQGTATSVNNLGLLARIAGDLDRARDLFTLAVDKWRLGGDRRGVAAALSNLAIVAPTRVRRRRPIGWASRHCTSTPIAASMKASSTA